MSETSSSRRRFLARLVGASAAGGVVSSVSADDTIELTMVSTWPRGAPGVGTNAERFAQYVNVMTGGRIAIRFHAAGELVPAFEALDAVQGGTADLAHSAPYYWVGKSKALHYFTGVPFGMTAVEFASWLYFGGGEALWDEVYRPLGVLPMYAGSSGTQAGGWFNREIRGIEDFRGLKFRIAGLGGEVLQRVGAVPVMTAPGEITPALASGAVDGADWIGPWNDIAFGLHKFARYYYMPGFHEPGPSLEIIANRKRFLALPTDLQAVLRQAARSTALETLCDFTFHNVQAFHDLQGKHGVEVRRFDDETVARLKQVSRDVLGELAASDPLVQRVHNSYMEFLARAAEYAPHGEQGFLNMRTPPGTG